MIGELRALQASGMLDEPRTNAGNGLAVLLIPGLLAPDRSLGLLARYLRRHGFTPRRAGIASNVDCSEREAGRLGVCSGHFFEQPAAHCLDKRSALSALAAMKS